MFSLRSPDYEPPIEVEHGDEEEEEEEEELVAGKPSALPQPPQPEGPVVTPYVAYDGDGYYDLICRFANDPNFRFSLLRRNRDKDWNILAENGGRLARLFRLVSEQNADCDEIVEAWAPETGVVTPPARAPIDYGAESPRRRTLESALINEIYYHLGLDRSAPPDMPPAFFVPYGSQFLYRKIHGPEGARTAILTGDVYLDDASPDPVAEATRYVDALQKDIAGSLGAFVRTVTIAPLAYEVVRYRSEGVRPVVHCVALVRWDGRDEEAGGLSREDIDKAFRSVGNLVIREPYRLRAFPDSVTAGGRNFADRMLQEIQEFFVGALAACKRRLPRDQVADLARRGAVFAAGTLDRFDPDRLPGDAAGGDIECYVPTWQWCAWNYALYSRTERDFAWFLKLDRDTILNTKSSLFLRVFDFLRRFYADDRQYAYVWTEVLDGLKSSHVDRSKGNLRSILLDWVFNAAFRTRYYLHAGGPNDADLRDPQESGGATYAEYREAAIPAFVLDQPRMKLIRDLLVFG